MDAMDADQPAAAEAKAAASFSPEPSRKPPRSSIELDGMAGLHDTIFEKLVSTENDVTGLLAYSLSMQIKREWLGAFRQEVGRDPTADELHAFDIGERIERRLTTYRKLAENALSGNSFWASTATTPVSEMAGAPAQEPLSPPSPSVSTAGTGSAKQQSKRWL